MVQWSIMGPVMSDMPEILKSLTPSELRVYEALAAAPRKSLRPDDLAVMANVAQSSLKVHVSRIKSKGILIRQKKGVYYLIEFSDSPLDLTDFGVCGYAECSTG